MHRLTHRKRVSLKVVTAALFGAGALSGCSPAVGPQSHAKPLVGPPVTDNVTPYTTCLTALAQYRSQNRPTVAVGQILDKTGQRSFDALNDSTELTQGVSEMVISALYRTRQVNLAERLDPRIPLAEQQMISQGLVSGPSAEGRVAPARFLVLGALTELNYNIQSGGERLFVAGIGGGNRAAVINVGLDMRLVDMSNFGTVYVTSLQKQIVGVEQEAGIFRFFGDRFVEFDSGQVRNEPMQLGVRSVVDLAVHQILTEGLGLPAKAKPGCSPGGDYPRQPRLGGTTPTEESKS